MKGREFNNRSVEALIKSGALDSLGANRRQMLSVYDRVMSGIASETRHNMSGQMDLFGLVDDNEHTKYEIEMPDVEEYPLNELLQMEKEIVGIYISGHPLDDISSFIPAAKLDVISSITNEENADKFSLLALEATRRRHEIKPVLTLRLYEEQNPELYNKTIVITGSTGGLGKEISFKLAGNNCNLIFINRNFFVYFL